MTREEILVVAEEERSAEVEVLPPSTAKSHSRSDDRGEAATPTAMFVVFIIALLAIPAVVGTIVKKNETITSYQHSVATYKTQLSDDQHAMEGLAQNLDAVKQELVRSCRATAFILESGSYIQTDYVRKAVRIHHKVCP